MQTSYKTYSVHNNYKPDYISDGDSSALLLRNYPIDDVLNKMAFIPYAPIKSGNVRKYRGYFPIIGYVSTTNETVILRGTVPSKNIDLNKRKCNNYCYFKQEDTVLRIRKSNKANTYDTLSIFPYNKNLYYRNIISDTYGCEPFSVCAYIKDTNEYDIEFSATKTKVYNHIYNEHFPENSVRYGSQTVHMINSTYFDNAKYEFKEFKPSRAITLYCEYSVIHKFSETIINSLNNLLDKTKSLLINNDERIYIRHKTVGGNTKQKSFTANVVFNDTSVIQKDCSSFSVNVVRNVIEKTGVSIKLNSDSISLVIQKGEFFELTLENSLAAENLPDNVTYYNDVISGTIYNSGEYNIEVTYNNTMKQIINIIVPFYRRIL